MKLAQKKKQDSEYEHNAKEASGIRLGTVAVTSRVFKEAEMVEVAQLIALAVKGFAARRDEIDARVAALCDRFPLYN